MKWPMFFCHQVAARKVMGDVAEYGKDIYDVTASQFCGASWNTRMNLTGLAGFHKEKSDAYTLACTVHLSAFLKRLHTSKLHCNFISFPDSIF